MLVPEKSLQKEKNKEKKNLTAFQQNSITNWLLSCSEFVEICALPPYHHHIRRKTKSSIKFPKNAFLKLKGKKCTFGLRNSPSITLMPNYFNT